MPQHPLPRPPVAGASPLRRARARSTARVPAWLPNWALGTVVLLALLATTGAARADDGTSLDGLLEQQVREFARSATQSNLPGIHRVDIEVGRLDPRLRLAPCQRIEPYLGPGVRPWGRIRIGLRCAAGPTPWNVYLPLTVKVYGTALVAATPLAAGSLVGPGDLVPAEVDLAEDPSAAVADAALAVGRALARPINPGQSLRQSHLRARQWFSAGESVKLIASGPGFAVAGSGQALNPGIEGQPVRVRTEGGRVVTGVPVGEREVELAL